MTSAQYAVIRIVADPARNEPINVGAILWRGADFRLHLDSEALELVVKRHSHFTRDALNYVEDYLLAGLSDVAECMPEGLKSALAELSRFPVSITEPRYLSLSTSKIDSLDEELSRIVGRMVHPPRIRAGGGPTIRQEIRKQLKLLIKSNMLAVDHAFPATRSGNYWSVDYYTEHSSNLAVDVLPLAICNADEIVRRAAAEAFKIYDIVVPQPVQFVVHCDFIPDDRFVEANHRARTCLEAVGVEVITEVSDLVGRIHAQLAPRLLTSDRTVE